MKISKVLLAGAMSAVLATGIAYASGFITNGLPQAGGTQYPSTIPLTGNELVPADTQLPSGLNPASEAISVRQLAGYDFAQPGSGGWRNGLIGGDFGNNLFQRGTTSASITTALLYGPDAWWGLSGTGTAFTIIQETGASDITNGYLASARVQRTAAQTGILPVCVGQVLTSQESARFQGQTAEFVTHMLLGANFSGANSNLTMTIGYSVAGATDQTAANFSTGSWTGYVAVNQTVTASTTWGRYSVVGAIPATATQVGVKICYTPVGTAGANDWFDFTGAQLDVNSAAIALTGVSGSTGSAATFERRPVVVENDLQFARYQLTTETNGGYIAPGMVSATNVERAILQLAVDMRATPTCTFTAGGLKWNIAGTQTAVGTLTQVTGTSNGSVTIGDTVTATAGGTAFLNGSATTGKISCTADL